MVDVLSPATKLAKKKGRKGKPIKKMTSSGRLYSPNKKEKGPSVATSLDKKSSAMRSEDEFPTYTNSVVFPISLREQGRDNASDEDEENSPTPLLTKRLNEESLPKPQLNINLNMNTLGKRSADNSTVSSEELNIEDDAYLISRNVESVKYSQTENHITSFNKTGDEFVNIDSKSASRRSSISSIKRQLNLSVRIKEGRATFKAATAGIVEDFGGNLPRIESQMESGSPGTDDRVIESML